MTNNPGPNCRIRFPQPTLGLLVFCVVIGMIARNLGTIDHLNDRDRAWRILLLHGQPCGEMTQISRDYGEGTLLVRCRQGRVYLLSAMEHCNSWRAVLTAYCWQVRIAASTVSPKIHVIICYSSPECPSRPIS